MANADRPSLLQVYATFGASIALRRQAKEVKPAGAADWMIIDAPVTDATSDQYCTHRQHRHA
jgi:hypothetical protein